MKGRISDDGFEIGRLTASDTLQLIVVTTVLGTITAVAYLLARPFLVDLAIPSVPSMALLSGVTGGALIVHTDGVDFTLLEPAALAVALFVGLIMSGLLILGGLDLVRDIIVLT